MFSSDRDAMRKIFFDAWRKHQEKIPLEPLEAQLIDIILLHPEYQALLDNPEQFQAVNFDETNPFLHLSLHLAIREQIKTNRPLGVTAIHETLCQRWQDTHLVEHNMFECLAQLLWEAQQSGKMADEETYLEKLRMLI
jgi:hypothetical protein